MQLPQVITQASAAFSDAAAFAVSLLLYVTSHDTPLSNTDKLTDLPSWTLVVWSLWLVIGSLTGMNTH